MGQAAFGKQDFLVTIKELHHTMLIVFISLREMSVAGFSQQRYRR